MAMAKATVNSNLLQAAFQLGAHYGTDVIAPAAMRVVEAQLRGEVAEEIIVTEDQERAEILAFLNPIAAGELTTIDEGEMPHSRRRVTQPILREAAAILVEAITRPR